MSPALEERVRLAFPPRRALTVKGAEPGATITFEDESPTFRSVSVSASVVARCWLTIHGS